MPLPHSAERSCCSLFWSRVAQGPVAGQFCCASCPKFSSWRLSCLYAVTQKLSTANKKTHSGCCLAPRGLEPPPTPVESHQLMNPNQTRSGNFGE